MRIGAQWQIGGLKTWVYNREAEDETIWLDGSKPWHGAPSVMKPYRPHGQDMTNKYELIAGWMLDIVDKWEEAGLIKENVQQRGYSW